MSTMSTTSIKRKTKNITKVGVEVWSCSSGLKQEAPPEFKASLGYTVSLRSPWAARQNFCLLKERKQEEKLKYTMTKQRGNDSIA